MENKHLLLLLLALILSPHKAINQNQPPPPQRFLIEASFITRLAASDLNIGEPVPVEIPVLYDRQDQLSGPGFRFSIGYSFPKHDWWIKYNHTIRYDVIYFNRYYTQPQIGSPTVDVPVDGIIQDLGITIYKGFTKWKYDPYLSFGVALHNRGTIYHDPVGHDTVGGVLIEIGYSVKNFNFPGIHAGIGLRHEKVSVELNTIIGFQSVFSRAGSLIIPEIKVGYSIAPPPRRSDPPLQL